MIDDYIIIERKFLSENFAVVYNITSLQSLLEGINTKRMLLVMDINATSLFAEPSPVGMIMMEMDLWNLEIRRPDGRFRPFGMKVLGILVGGDMRSSPPT